MRTLNVVLMRRIGIVLLLFAVVCPAFAKTIYVKQGASGNGISWTNAYGNLQNALNAANSGDQIWVAQGIYRPTYTYDLNTASRYRHFRMKNGVAIYGGFAGTETSLNQRDIYSNETILSGDLNGNDGPNFADRDDNCLHVFYHPNGTNLNTTAVLDGFTVTAGNADTLDPHDKGAGMFNFSSSPTVTNCVFNANRVSSGGGGMYNYLNSHPTVTSCIFEGNWGQVLAGGMWNKDQSNPTVSNCIFFGNMAVSYDGGAMYNSGSSPVMTNCTFSGNTTGRYGGGMSNFFSSSPTLTNCIFWGNSAALTSDEIYNNPTSTTLIVYSNIFGCLAGGSWNSSLGTNGGGNMDENPYFDRYLQLQSPSPCIDAADDDAAPATDLLGNARYNSADMGAYEYQGSTAPPKPAMFINSLGASNVSITSSTGHGGSTNYDYIPTVNEGTNVSLTAPETWGLSIFTGWTGSAINSNNETISIPMNISEFVRAWYEKPASTTYLVSIYSYGVSGVPITSSTGHGGTTTYNTEVLEGRTTTLTAPATWGGKTFTGWTGAVTSSDQTISFSINSSSDTNWLMAWYETGTTPTHTLSVNSSGATGVAISSSTGHGGTTNYTKTVDDGTTVTLTAPATSGGATFTGWTGSVSSSNRTISLSMNANKSVTANYETATTTRTLYVYSSGATSVPISSSTGHGGTTNYTKTVDDGTTVTLTAPATSGGKTFTGWSGSVSSSNQTISLSMNANKSVTANYETVITTHSLNVYSSGATGVSISSSSGHGGTTDYIRTVTEGTTVTLTAPSTWGGATFTGWTGSVSSSNRTISFSMNANKYVTANYETATTTYTLYVYSSGATGVSISSSTGHGGTTNYTKTVGDGTTVTLTAPATSGGATFTGWSGSVSSSNQTISLSMNANKSVTANYETSTTSKTLTVSSAGATGVTISSYNGHGGTTTYSTTANNGSYVNVIAPATADGKAFTGWTGSYTSSNQSIWILMDANKSVTANYGGGTTTTHTLYVYSSGATSVAISSSTGHSGTTNYTKTVDDGTTVTLTAPATSGGATFTGWTGSVTSSNQTISLSMNAAKSVTANYESATTTHTLYVYSSGATSVPISSSGHGGTTNYTKTVTDGTTVTLTAPATSGGATFTGWTGSVSSSNQTISLSMNASKSVTANYETAGPAVPAAPSSLSATAVATTQINLSWIDNAGNETGFKIERSFRISGNFEEIGTVGANVTSYSDTTVRKGTTYYYRVRATNAGGDSSYSNEANATTQKK